MDKINPVVDKYILTFSNLASGPAICKALLTGQKLKALSITIATFCSMIHHADETRFYGPAILDFSPLTQFILLQLDRLGAILPIIIVGGPDIVRDYLVWIILLLGIMLGSDLVFYPPSSYYLSFSTQRFLRIALHTPWHIGALGIMAYVAVTDYANAVTFWDMLYKYFV